MVTLERCQFVEETLRGYINLEIKKNKLTPKSHFPVRLNSKNLSRLSLGKLVSIFSNLNDDTSLISSLKKLIKERNFIAHESKLLTVGELKDPDYMSSVLDKVSKIKEHAKAAHESLLDKNNDLRRLLSALHRKVSSECDVAEENNV